METRSPSKRSRCKATPRRNTLSQEGVYRGGVRNMLSRTGTFSLAALVLTTLGLVAMPVGGYAQEKDTDTTATDKQNQLVNLDLEDAILYYGLNLLFQHIKANFQLDPSLKQLSVTA